MAEWILTEAKKETGREGRTKYFWSGGAISLLRRGLHCIKGHCWRLSREFDDEDEYRCNCGMIAEVARYGRCRECGTPLRAGKSIKTGTCGACRGDEFAVPFWKWNMWNV